MKFTVNKQLLEQLSPADRRRVLDRVAAYARQHKDNPLWKFRQHDRQGLFLASRDPMKLFLGGNRSGKTTCGIVDDLIQAVDRDVLPPHLQGFKFWEPPFACRIIVPDFTQTLQGVTLQKIREWAPKAQLEGGGFDAAYDARDHMLWFKNGSYFQFMTFEQALDKFQGAALDRVHYDEEPPERIRRENQMRLIDRDGQEMYTMTPLSGMTFTFEVFYEPWEKLQPEGWSPDEPEGEEVSVELPQGRTTVVTVDMDDNPHLSEKAKRRIIDDPTLSAEERQARKRGRFISFAGLVYGHSFRKDRNVVLDVGPPRAIPSSKEYEGGVPEGADVFVGIDPGLRHMAAVVWVWLDHNDEMVVFDELALKDQTIEEVCKQIHLKNAEWRVIPRWYVIDPASRNRSGQTGRSDQMEYADHGIFAIPGQNAVTTGINRVKARLEGAWMEDSLVSVAGRRSRPSLYVSERSVTLLEQLKRYRWAAHTRSEDEPRERPVKRDDHLLDALRYIVMSRPSPPEAPIETPEGDWMAELIKADIESSQSNGTSHPQGPGVLA